MIMRKFKVGDKIRCVDSHRFHTHLTVGKVYTVLREDADIRYVHIEPDFGISTGGYRVERFELVQGDAVLTPEEVFEHLRKGTQLQCSHKATGNWCNHYGTLNRIKVNELIDYNWRIKPEPEVIELNGKKYREIID